MDESNRMVSAEDLGESIEKVGSIANQTGTSFDSLNGFTTELVSNMNLTGTEAGTALKTIFSRVYTDGGKAQLALKKIGVQVVDSNGKLKPMMTILKQTSKAFDGLSQAQKVSIEQALGGTYQYAKVKTKCLAYSVTSECFGLIAGNG